MKARRASIVVTTTMLLTAPPVLAAALSIDGGSLSIYGLSVQLPVVPASVAIEPESLRPGARGERVLAVIEAPGPAFDVRAIDAASIRLCLDGPLCDSGVPAGPKPKVGDADGDGVLDLKVAFERADVLALIAHVTPPAEVDLVVSGVITSGAAFTGTDTVGLVGPDPAGATSVPVTSAGDEPTRAGTPRASAGPPATPDPTASSPPNAEPTTTPGGPRESPAPASPSATVAPRPERPDDSSQDANAEPTPDPSEKPSPVPPPEPTPDPSEEPSPVPPPEPTPTPLPEAAPTLGAAPEPTPTPLPEAAPTLGAPLGGSSDPRPRRRRPGVVAGRSRRCDAHPR